MDKVETYGDELGTVSTAAFSALGAVVTKLRHKRFSDPGWFYGGVTTTPCPADGKILHVFRKKYLSSGREYLYAACVCTECGSAVAAGDLGLKTSDLGIGSELQQPAGDCPPAQQESNIGLEFHALLIECVASLPTDDLRQVLMARLGIGRNAQTLREIAGRQRLPEGNIRELQNRALTILGTMARQDPGSPPHKLAVHLGLGAQPRHLAVAQEVHRVVREYPASLARQRTLICLQMAGAAPSCSRHIATMVAAQIMASEEWEAAHADGAADAVI